MGTVEDQIRLPSLRTPPIAFAHRGARAHAPENTLDAFRLGLRLGAEGLETDAWCTADGEVVLDHDGVVRHGWRRRALREVPRRDLPAHVPTLGELYEACGTDFELSIDVKDPTAAETIVALAREADATGRLWLCHPDWEQVARWRALDADLHLVDSTRLRKIREGPERRAANLRKAGIDAVNLHHTDWSGGLVSLFHRFERYALAWDAQHVRIIRILVRMGVDGVFSDHVDRLVDGITAEA